MDYKKLEEEKNKSTKLTFMHGFLNFMQISLDTLLSGGPTLVNINFTTIAKCENQVGVKLGG